MTAHLQMNWFGLLFFVLTAIFIVLLLVSFFKNAPLIIPMLMGVAIVICMYAALMSIVVFNFIGYC